MPHLLIALCSYSQLVRLRADSLPETEDAVRGLLAEAEARVVWHSRGCLLAACGPEAGPAADLALNILDSLRQRREHLFGFSLVLHELAGAPPEDEARRLADEALALEPEEELWVSLPAAGRFDGVLETRPHGALLKVIGPAAGRMPGRGPASAAGSAPWVRQKLVERCLDLAARRLNDGGNRTVLFLHGPAGAGKTALLAEVARRLGCTGPSAPLRAYALFRRRTPLHPFLNSLDPGFLPEVPALLTSAERRVWEDLGGIIAGIVRPGTITAVPDRIVTDFFLAYRLYARAWARRVVRTLVPALVACEDVESWHPAAREAARAFIDDLLTEPSVIVAVTSTLEALPGEFAELETTSLPVAPLGRREIRSFAQFLFPGLELPEAVVRRIRGRSGGLPVPVKSFLLYLEQIGSIRAVDAGWAWTQDPLSVSWLLIRSLADDSFLLLYALYLAAGLLDREGLLDFLEDAGFDRRDAGESLAHLLASGLVDEEECLVPRYPGLRSRLQELLAEEASQLTERFADHLVALWQRGAFPREVLLFSFLARNGRTADALRVLPGIVRRKIDERDLAGARAFTDPSRLAFVRPPDAGERTMLGVVCSAGRLRAAVLEERLEEADGLVHELARFAREGPAHVLAAEAALASARYYLAAGDSASALDVVKRGLGVAQEAGAGGAAAVREATLLLGATMLADGRLGEAVEYAGLAERDAREAADRLGALRAGSLLASCHFLEGRLTRAAECAASALALAGTIGQRDDEVFLGFLTARIRFLLGDYEGCSVALQRCLCLCELYRMDAAEPVLDAWIARSLVYAGDAAAGTVRFERLEATREVLLFQAEAAFFAGDPGAASSALERGLAMPAESVFPPPHGGCWRDGFLWPGRTRACSGSSSRCAGTCGLGAVPSRKPCASWASSCRACGRPTTTRTSTSTSTSMPTRCRKRRARTTRSRCSPRRSRGCRSGRAASTPPRNARPSST
jgi:tetratricopeptide (TPR) repeat protein